MSLASTTSIIQYTLTGTGQVLNVGFNFNAAADLVVTATVAGADTLLALGTDYTVQGGGFDATGTVTMENGWGSTASTVITIDRQPAQTQGSTYTPGGAFPSQTTEQALDKLTMICQGLQQQLNRCLRVPDTNAAIAPMTLAARANNHIGFSSNGQIAFLST